jgi:hypothetical protein
LSGSRASNAATSGAEETMSATPDLPLLADVLVTFATAD